MQQKHRIEKISKKSLGAGWKGLGLLISIILVLDSNVVPLHSNYSPLTKQGEIETLCLCIINADMLFQRINIVLSPGQRICRAGSYDPVVILQIHSIAVFDKDKNPPYFQPLFDFLTSELKVPEKR